MRGRGLDEAGLDELFDGATGWLFEVFPRTDKDGVIVGFNPRKARSWLMRRCVRTGLFDPATPVRGRGVWGDGEDGLIVHCGDALHLDGAWRGAGMLRDGAIYAASSPIARPGDDVAPAAVGRELRDAIGRWNWRDPIGPDAVCGFIGQAFLGAAGDWRGHMFVIAEYGAGKTTLAELVSAALGPAGHPLQNNFTEAGLRQALTGEARALLLDEAEHDEGGGWVRTVIELIRHMSGGSGARVVRGTAGGQAQGFTMAGAAYLSAVLTGGLKPQDRSRITVVHLDRLTKGIETSGNRERVRQATDAMKRAAPTLWGRAIAGWSRYNETLTAWRESFVAAGLSARAADQISVFAAGRDLLMLDDVPEPGAIADELENWLAIAGHDADDDLEGEGLECIGHLFSWPLDAWRGGDRRTVGELLLHAMTDVDDHTRRSLQTLGLRLENHLIADKRLLMVANRHVGLERIFRDTRWSGQGWVDALRHLDGVDAADQPVRFTGMRCRATAVLAVYLPLDEGCIQPPHDASVTL